MHSNLKRRCRMLQIIAAIFPLVGLAAPAGADIYQWEYFGYSSIARSAVLAPDGAGVDAVPGANLSGRNLTMAFLIGADLTFASARGTNLTNAELSAATLTDVDFTGAELRGASFQRFYMNHFGTGITLAQLYSTASYQARDLSGIRIDNDLIGANFARQNLTDAIFGAALLSGGDFRQANLANARFNALYDSCSLCTSGPSLHSSTLTDADFTGAEVRGASFSRGSASEEGTGITLVQLYSTASYQAGDLSGLGLNYNNLAGGNFVGQNITGTSFYDAELANADFRGANLTNGNFIGATLTDAEFSNADISGANFSKEIYMANFPGGMTLPVIGSGTGISPAQLYSAASYQVGELSGVRFGHNDLAGANFAGQNLSNADFAGASLAGADFTGADVRGTNFTRSFGLIPFNSGIMPAQLYSTSSYQAHNLAGIGLGGNDLSGADIVGQNLTNASFDGATLTDADLTAADARGSYGLNASSLSSATTTSLIWPNGHIDGLNLEAGGLLVVRDLDGPSWFPELVIPITVDRDLAMGAGGTLRMVLEADAWDSKISFAPGIPVMLGGTLEITFAPDVNLASQVGRTFDVFDWTGVNPTGAFAVASPYAWDLSNLYATGKVTLTAVPEPSTRLLLSVALAAFVLLRRSKRVLQVAAAVFPLLAFAGPARADIFQWEYINPADPGQGKQRGTTLAPDGAGVDAITGAVLALHNLSMAYLEDADLSHSALQGAILKKASLRGAKLLDADLSPFVFDYAFATDLTDADFSEANLINANFDQATLTDADFTGANVREASFTRNEFYPYGTGITLAQLYSTSSYHAHDLTGISLGGNDLAGGNFAGQKLTNASFETYSSFDWRFVYVARLTKADFTGANLTNANFGAADLTSANFRDANLANAAFTGVVSCPYGLCSAYATLTDANLTAADARGADLYSEYANAITTNLIWRDGHIHGLGLDDGGLLVVRDDDVGSLYYPDAAPIPISIDQHLTMGAGGTLRIVFDADAWDSTISFAPGIPVTLGGTLELTFATDVNLASQVGRTFDLFDWTGVNPTGAFAVAGPYAWDLSNLYATGEVTLTAVPEPSTRLLLSAALAAFVLLRRSKRVLQVAAAVFPLLAFASPARADIFQWEYINLADPSQGKQQSTTLAPDGAGLDAVPAAHLDSRNLTMAYLMGADLTGANGNFANLTAADLTQANLGNANFANAILTGADLSQANLSSTNFGGVTLTGANFTGAEIRGASFRRIPDTYAGNANLFGTGITKAQLYSTASYQSHDLTGIGFSGNDLSGANFAGQNLTNSSFSSATLMDADFTGAEVKGARFAAGSVESYSGQFSAVGTGISPAQLYSTASYQARDLTGIGLYAIDLSGGNFASQNLTNADFSFATLTGANFTDAEVRGANFGKYSTFGSIGTGITLAQLYSTASYQAHDLTGIGLSGNYLSGANLVDQNLTNADFHGATLMGADFTNADVRGANLATYSSGTGITLSQLYSTASYQARDLSRIDLRENNFAGANFAGQNLIGANFTLATLTNADFTAANLADASLNGANLTGAKFRQASVPNVDFAAANLTGADFSQGTLTNAGFKLATLTSANFGQANLTHANFGGAKLTGADLNSADVRGANFDRMYDYYSDYYYGTGITPAQLYSTASYQAHDLSGIDLTYSDLAGANFAGQNLTNAIFSYATLTNANLSQANLTNAIFSYATLTNANLSQTNLANLDFSSATLTGADFAGAQVRGANFYGESYAGYATGITPAQLYSTASFQSHDMTGIRLAYNNLAGASFVGQNLTSADFYRATLTDANFSEANLSYSSFYSATLTGADFTAAVVRGAFFGEATSRGFTASQLYATASYRAHDLREIGLGGFNNLSGWNFAGQNLTNSSFGEFYPDFSLPPHPWPVYYSTLTGADFTGADARGAFLNYSDAITTNLILPDGHIAGLELNDGSLLVVRDYDGNPGRSLLDGILFQMISSPSPPISITIDQHVSMSPGGTLRMAFEADAWDSTISFAPGIPVTLGGTLELTFAANVNLASQLGRTFTLFDWTGVDPTGAFTVSSPFRWNVANLYTTGEVTLTAIPEPATIVLLALAAGICFKRRRILAGNVT